jgi:hypothetical protein
MLTNPDVRSWISTLLGVVIVCGLFGADLLHFHQAGTTADVALIVGAVGALGIRTGFSAGQQSAVTKLATASPVNPTPKV